MPTTEQEFFELITAILRTAGTAAARLMPSCGLDPAAFALPEETCSAIAANTVLDWKNHAWRGGEFTDYDSMVAVLIVNLFGAVRKLDMKTADQPRLNHLLMTAVDKILYQDMVRARFLSISGRLVLRKAA